VLLGNSFTVLDTHEEYERPPMEALSTGEIRCYDSVTCPGFFIPNPDINAYYKGSLMRIGETVMNKKHVPSCCSTDRSEYVVYNPEKVKVKYLVQIKKVTYTVNTSLSQLYFLIL